MSSPQTWASHWSFPPEVIYLNHGSFGPSPRVVQEARQAWTTRLETQPCLFFLRGLVEALNEARQALANFLNCAADDLGFVDNATTGMNVVAASFPLEEGDEVLLTDHEYGAVQRIWEHTCQESGAILKTATIPLPIQSADEVIQALLTEITPNTKLLVVSHVSSATAIVFPVEKITAAFQEKGIAVCIDGPHAVAMRDVNLSALDCDFYTASCHKWLCAGFGSGFLYVHPRHRDSIQPPVRSWGRMPGREPQRWQDELEWQGTRDPAAFLSIPTAIQFLSEIGLDAFRSHGYEGVKAAYDRLTPLCRGPLLVPMAQDWLGTMVSLPIGEVNPLGLGGDLWLKNLIEVPIFTWNDYHFLRISWHIYNQEKHLDKLEQSLKSLLPL
ncbi:Aminotransferase class V-fold PLP-dependent enzyme [Planctomycetales bacterium 10988]|nr:Aminotransferase class V-fold PLP-dependent enzyme [Planctomycetales bacterium 10988]